MSLTRKALRRDFKPQKQHDEVLILTNGKNTERFYFNNIRKHFDTIYKITVKYKCNDVLSLIKAAIEIKNSNKQINQIWCVFDIDDSFVEGKIVEALALAKKEKIKFAFSNESFEVWLLLHYIKHSEIGTGGRRHYKRKLESILKSSYSKNKDAEKMIEESFIPKVKKAIQNAKCAYETRLVEHKKLNPTIVIPIWEWIPSTNVYMLLEVLKLTPKKYD